MSHEISKKVEEIVVLSVSNVDHDDLTRDDRKYLIYEIIDRILNAKIGALVREYRSDNLTRNSDAAFTTEVGVLAKRCSTKK